MHIPYNAVFSAFFFSKTVLKPLSIFKYNQKNLANYLTASCLFNYFLSIPTLLYDLAAVESLKMPRHKKKAARYGTSCPLGGLILQYRCIITEIRLWRNSCLVQSRISSSNRTIYIQFYFSSRSSGNFQNVTIASQTLLFIFRNCSRTESYSFYIRILI